MSGMRIALIVLGLVMLAEPAMAYWPGYPYAYPYSYASPYSHAPIPLYPEVYHHPREWDWRRSNWREERREDWRRPNWREERREDWHRQHWCEHHPWECRR